MANSLLLLFNFTSAASFPGFYNNYLRAAVKARNLFSEGAYPISIAAL
jgi:hypothetical protein